MFVLQNGDYFTLTYVNQLLFKFLDHNFDPKFGKFLCHSFRAGLPSIMAANPNLFSKEETMEVGRWSSDAFLRYTRLYGLRAKTISEKLDVALGSFMLLYYFLILAAILSKEVLAEAIRNAKKSLIDETFHTPGDPSFGLPHQGHIIDNFSYVIFTNV